MHEALANRRGGLGPCDFEPRLQTVVGEVAGLADVALPAALAHFDCRNNRLAQLALEADGFADAVATARERYGAARIGVMLGTSTSGIHQTELAYQRRDPETGALPADFQFEFTHDLLASARFVREALQLRGPQAMVSTACSSSAKVFASAWRLMTTGVCDAVVVGGVDSLCLNTLYGFSSLELVSDEATTPCAADRKGINIGEAAGFALLEWPERAVDAGSGIVLLGYGESSDAYHMSTPRPDGEGAALAMARALERASLKGSDIDYINMHGTASQVNDAMEDKAISRVCGTDTAASSTKGWTGHTLGAAGITEAAIAFAAITHQFRPGTLNTKAVDPSFTSRILLDNETGTVRRVLSNSFGFGGSNCALVFGAA